MIVLCMSIYFPALCRYEIISKGSKAGGPLRIMHTEIDWTVIDHHSRQQTSIIHIVSDSERVRDASWTDLKRRCKYHA